MPRKDYKALNQEKEPFEIILADKPKRDKDGNVVYAPQPVYEEVPVFDDLLDDQGNPILDDEGNTVLDESSEPVGWEERPVLDDDGNPVLEDQPVMVPHIIRLPKVLPAKLMMDLRFKDLEKLNPEEEGELGFGFIETLFGREDWDALLSEIGIDAIPELMEEILAYYGFGKKGEVSEAPDPKEATEREEAPTHPEAQPGTDPSLSTTASNTSESLTLTSSDSGQETETDTTPKPSNGRSSSSGSEVSPPIALS